MNIYNKINNHEVEWLRLLSAESQEERKHNQYSETLKFHNFVPSYDMFKKKTINMFVC